jgi:hypothetical protein
MSRKKKLGTLRGVGQWKALETAGDVKRFLAWCIHSVREQSLDPKTAAILGQLGSFLLKAVETSDFERRLADIEARLTASEHHESGNTPGTY